MDFLGTPLVIERSPGYCRPAAHSVNERIRPSKHVAELSNASVTAGLGRLELAPGFVQQATGLGTLADQVLDTGELRFPPREIGLPSASPLPRATATTATITVSGHAGLSGIRLADLATVGLHGGAFVLA